MKEENQIVMAVKGIILHEGKFLIVQRSPHDSGGGTWEFPGGKLDFGEQLESALAREIEEETGLSASVKRILYATSFFTHAHRQVVINTYLCTADRNDVTLSFEHSDHKWVDFADAQNYLPENIKHDFERYQVANMPEFLHM
ncbi:NUDIX hydrolase [Falsibacillus pallidus]|uniref:8-oxo-dGTP diphosphatase n=1 Tax=Falsibacillus pallidus TaxID=493781 RepID=A0A370GRE7_9BACI|nr:NUDIX domain-containing protein [Falsibacillus pallidus]RDI45816.1 8-oxo-dGTP diphosphatase [Falsibacillus pallidus]